MAIKHIEIHVHFSDGYYQRSLQMQSKYKIASIVPIGSFL